MVRAPVTDQQIQQIHFPQRVVPVAMGLAGRDGGTLTMNLELKDSGIDADSAFSLVLSMAGGLN